MAVSRHVQFMVVLILIVNSYAFSEKKKIDINSKKEFNQRNPVNEIGIEKNRQGDENVLLNDHHPMGQKMRSHGNARKRVSMPKISELSECKKEVKRFCSKNTYDNNFEVLECLQNDLKVGDELAKECQHLLWLFKRNLTKDDRFEYAGKEVCRHELAMTADCHTLDSGLVIPCLIEYIDNITNSNCKQFLLKMGSIIFSDYRLVYNFVNHCQKDISDLKCGRVQLEDEDDSPHLQGKTIECLKEKTKLLSQACLLQVHRVTELQADDYHLDRPLYYACRVDRERFCDEVPAGSGRVFDCLARHKFERDMSEACRQKLVLRQQLIAEDIKIEKGFFAACHRDIKRYSCMQGSHGSQVLQRATVMLCLENAMKKDMPVTAECTAEVDDMRKSIMEDFQISPEIVVNCDKEIREHCGGGSNKEGKTLHCLMDLARPVSFKGSHKLAKQIGQACEIQLNNLLHEADVGQDFRIDRALQRACQPVVDVACRDIQPGDARILSCLMEKLGTDKMTGDCEERLIEIQYFISRNFRLAPSVYRKCRKDAAELCHVTGDWRQLDEVHQGALEDNRPPQYVLACLYRQSKSKKV